MNLVISHIAAAAVATAACLMLQSVLDQPAPTVEPEVHVVELVQEIEVPRLEDTEYSRNEMLYLAATMWGEARSDGAVGMRAVGHVILNRVNSPNDRRFGSTLTEVMFRDRQFSAWNHEDPNRMRMMRLVDGWLPRGEDGDAWLIAQTLASDILAGRSEDPTNGALYYHTHEVDPAWNDHAQGELILASHVFYQSTR